MSPAAYGWRMESVRSRREAVVREHMEAENVHDFDTVIATFTLALAAGATAFEAAHLANIAGGLVVMKRGTAVVTTAELEHALQHG